MFLDTLKQAKKMQTELLNLCLRLKTGALGEEVSKLNICIIGGGATGVELAAKLREATEQFARNGIDKLLDLSSVTITLVAALPEKVSEKVEKKLLGIDIDLRLASMVEDATAEGVRLKDGDMVPVELVIWAAGIKAPAILNELGVFDIGSLGRILTHPTLQTANCDAVFAIGDCAECRWPEQGTALPPRA